MPTFGERIEEHRRACGLTQVDLCEITGQSRSRVNEYIKKDDTPTYGAFLEMSRSLWTSRDWLSGEPNAERWCPAIQEFRLVARDAARSMNPAMNVYERMVAVLKLAEQHLQLPEDDWLMPAVVNIGGKDGADAPGIEQNLRLYREFKEGGYKRDTLTWVMRRIAAFTNLPRLWIELGRSSELDPASIDDLGSWARTIARMRRLGHTPEMYDSHMESIDDLFRRYST